jgi:hypothetical protein
MSTPSVFATLSTINCEKHIETKPTGNGKPLSYLSWAWAWQILKEKYPSAFYTIYENKDGLNYHTDGRTCWVKTGVTVEGIEHIEYLPVMDFRNASIPVGKVTSYDVNKSIQRSLTKAVARHGLGLYIYAGEDIPDPYDDELRAMVANYVSPNEKAAPTSLSAPKADKPIMHQGHDNWLAILKTIASGQFTLEQYKKKYYFPEADEIAAKEWILNNQQL